MLLPAGCGHDGFIGVPAGSCSIAIDLCVLGASPCFGSPPGTAATGAGRFGDLRLIVFTVRERAAVLGFDFVLVMGSS